MGIEQSPEGRGRRELANLVQGQEAAYTPQVGATGRTWKEHGLGTHTRAGRQDWSVESFLSEPHGAHCLCA